MSDEPLYDPDRMSVNDLDLTDPKVASAYFNHPVTDALCADLGRSFSTLPVGEQRRQVLEKIEHFEHVRAKLAEARDSVSTSDPTHAELQDLVERMAPYINGAKLQLLELDDEP